MRIVIDATAAMSGGRVYLMQLLPQLVRQAEGGEFIVFYAGEATPGWEAIRAACEAPDVRATVRFQAIGGLGANNRVWLGKAILKWLWRTLVFPWHLWRLQPDLLFSNAGVAPGWWPGRTRLVLALHNSMPLRAELIAEERTTLARWRLRLLRRLMRRAVHQAAATIVFSHDTRARVIAEFGAAPERLFVVHHGIEWGERERLARAEPHALVGTDLGAASWPERQATAAGSTAIPLSVPYVLYVSQWHRYKNLLRLLAAFAQVRRTQPRLALVLLGDAADAGYWREVTAHIAQLGLTGHVHALPGCAREELLRWYRGALAFVHPSLAETCSFPLLEALALGVPVAAARMSALPEIAGDAACYFDPYQVEEIAHMLERIIRDDALRGRLSARAAQRAQLFTWEAAATQTLAVLQQVAASKS